MERWGPDPFIFSPAEDMDRYLNARGEHSEIFYELSDECVHGLNIYHYAGTHVAVRYRLFTHMHTHGQAGNVWMFIMSEGPSDDVVERLRRKFSYLVKC